MFRVEGSVFSLGPRVSSGFNFHKGFRVVMP